MACVVKCSVKHVQNLEQPLNAETPESYNSMVDIIKEVKKEMGLKGEPELIPPNMAYKDWKDMFEYHVRTQKGYGKTKDGNYFRALVVATDKCIKSGKADKVS